MLDQVQYKDWGFRLTEVHTAQGPAPVLQVTFSAPDAHSGSVQLQQGRPWLLQPESEVELLQTVLLAVLTAEEHEARERFLYQGERVFSPHRGRHILHLPLSR